MDQWLERLGYAAQWVNDSLQTAAQTAAHSAADATERLAEEAGDEEAQDSAVSAAVTAIATGLAARWLRAEEVAWTRAVLAGVVGTLLYDATMLLDQRLFGRKFDTIGPLGEALTDDPEMQRWAGWAAHYAGGVGLAILYARYLHARLPGPGVVRGATFGLLDMATLTWGGLHPLLKQFGGSLPIPAGYAALAHSPQITAQSVLRHLAYGAAVGAVYSLNDE